MGFRWEDVVRRRSLTNKNKTVLFVLADKIPRQVSGCASPTNDRDLTRSAVRIRWPRLRRKTTLTEVNKNRRSTTDTDEYDSAVTTHQQTSDVLCDLGAVLDSTEDSEHG